jgi:hypothetical protein
VDRVHEDALSNRRHTIEEEKKKTFGDIISAPLGYSKSQLSNAQEGEK